MCYSMVYDGLFTGLRGDADRIFPESDLARIIGETGLLSILNYGCI